ncbi:uncharacterized protein G2W53_033647 [Senna tora]|uniref:Uncharacterized protein n=1 Tax=Senna tora TaxID=362788 RepID=A0A834T1M7_9FABA|nr:uncharacterized protein G2W53_033647 [Senna tora]
MGGTWIMTQHILDDKSRSDLRNLHELRGKILVPQVCQTRRFVLYSRTGVVLMLQRELSWHGRSVDHVSTYFGRQIAVRSQKPSRITRQKTCCASVSNTSVRFVFANRCGFDAPIGVVLAWEERGSCLNIFRTTIAVRSQKPSRITRQNTCCASVSNMSVRVVFANRSGFDAPIVVVLAWDERGSLSQTRRFALYSRIGVVLMLQLESSWHGRSVDHVSTNSGRQITSRLGMGGAWIMSQHIPDDKSLSDLKNLHELQGKRLVAQVSQTRRFAVYTRTGVVLMLQLESSWHGRSVDHVSTYSGRQIAVGSQKPSQISRQKTCCASEANMSIRVVFANRSGFDAPIGVVLAWEERGSCRNKFRTTNRGRILETFTNYEANYLLRKCVKHIGSRTGVVLMLQLESSWHGRSVDHLSTYSG